MAGTLRLVEDMRSRAVDVFVGYIRRGRLSHFLLFLKVVNLVDELCGLKRHPGTVTY